MCLVGTECDVESIDSRRFKQSSNHRERISSTKHDIGWIDTIGMSTYLREKKWGRKICAFYSSTKSDSWKSDTQLRLRATASWTRRYSNIWPCQLKVPWYHPPCYNYKLYTHTHTHTHTHTCIVVAYTYLRVYFMITTTIAHRATLFLLASKELNDIVFQLQRVAYSPDTTRCAQRVLWNAYEIIRPTNVYFSMRHCSHTKHYRFFIFS